MACNDALCWVARVGLPARPRVFSVLRRGSAPTAAASRANVGIARVAALPSARWGSPRERPGVGQVYRG
jgi:hypothetical protein